MARAPPTASAASTQKSIASMHSPLSLAVGYNRIVTHGRRSCNNVVATLAKDKTPSLQRSSRCRAPASILPLATLLFSASCGAASALRPLRVARDLGWCDHDYPGGRAQHLVTHASDFPVLGAPASIIGSELPQSLLWGSDSSLRPVPMP